MKTDSTSACGPAMQADSDIPLTDALSDLEVRVAEKAGRLIELAKASQLTVCSCESFTAGLFSSTLAGVSGASSVLKGGLVVYWASMKEKLAHVDPVLIATHGVVSEACARAMASNTRVIMDADFCVSFTGNAGPLAQEGKPVGLIYCGLASRYQTECFCWKLDFPRNPLRLQAVLLMMEKLIEAMEKRAVK